MFIGLINDLKHRSYSQRVRKYEYDQVKLIHLAVGVLLILSLGYVTLLFRYDIVDKYKRLRMVTNANILINFLYHIVHIFTV